MEILTASNSNYFLSDIFLARLWHKGFDALFPLQQVASLVFRQTYFNSFIFTSINA